jgi:hypothetical protein
MRFAQLATLVSLVAVLAGCGGGGGSSSAGGGTTTTSSLVTKVSDVKVDVKGKLVTSSAKVEVGGKPGTKFLLRMGLVDAVSGSRASQGEQVIAHITTTPDVVTKTYTTTFNPHIPTDYIVHWALSTPAGVFVASSDSDVFTYSG